ncbi:MAG: hypothetical protein LBQ74_12945 [Prevotella sp.]|jgi:hypothetical protein|nr:hypothetical protein [Prevotella sp.]
MDKNVLIKFTADTGGLDEATQKLDALTDREKELLKQIELLKREQQAAQMMAKNADEQTKATKKYGDKVAEARKELVQTRKSIEDVSKAQKELEKTVAKGTIEKSFRTVRMELQEQLRQMRINGQAGTEEYDKLIAKLAEMNRTQQAVNAEMKSQSSITYTFDSIMKGTQLATGAYTTLTAAQSIFGTENKDLQKTMATLQTAMTASIGVQQLYTATVGAGGVIQRVMTLQTKARTAAELASTKGTIAATISQKAFNIVANANPYVLLATALITVVGALYLFASNTDTAAERQKMLNDLEARHLGLLKDIADYSGRHNQERIKELEAELRIAQARGASMSEIRRIEDAIAIARTKDHNERVGFFKDEINNLDANNKALLEQKILLDAINDAKDSGSKEYLLDVKLDGNLKNTDIDKAIELVQSRIDKYNKKVEVGATLKTEGEDLDAKAKEEKAKRDKEDFERGKKNAIALAEYKALMTNKGSKEELEAQIIVAKTKLKYDLLNVDITKGERMKKTKENLLEIEKLENAYRINQLNNDLLIINAGLSAAKEGSEEEHQLKLKQLQKQRDIELATLNLTEAKKEEIYAKFYKDAEKLEKEHAQYLSEARTNATISEINTRLTKVKEGSDKELSLKIKLLQAQANQEREAAEASIKNEEEKAARIKKINANLQKDINDLTLDSGIKRIQQTADKETLAITQQYEQGKLSKWEYEASLDQITIDSLQKQIDERRKFGEDTIELEQELSEKRKEIMDEEAEYRKQVIEEAMNLFVSIQNSMYSSEKERLSQQLADLNYYYTTDAEEAKKDANKKYISEKELEKRQLEIKRQQWKVEKEEALFNAYVNMAQGITKALASAPPPYNAILAGITAAMALVQINAINAKQPPKGYEKGRKTGIGEFALVGEKGPELMYVPNLAAIMPAHDTRKALSGDMSVMSKWNMPEMSLPKKEPAYIPPMPHIPQYMIYETRRNAGNKGVEIDYDILGDKVGKAVARYRKQPKDKPIKINFDRDGLSVTRGNTTTHYLNTKGNV